MGDIIKEKADDNSNELKRVNKSDASEFATRFRWCPALGWGIIWTIIAFMFYAGGVLLGLAVFKVDLHS